MLGVAIAIGVVLPPATAQNCEAKVGCSSCVESWDCAYCREWENGTAARCLGVDSADGVKGDVCPSGCKSCAYKDCHIDAHEAVIIIAVSVSAAVLLVVGCTIYWWLRCRRRGADKRYKRME